MGVFAHVNAKYGRRSGLSASAQVNHLSIVNRYRPLAGSAGLLRPQDGCPSHRFRNAQLPPDLENDLEDKYASIACQTDNSR